MPYLETIKPKKLVVCVIFFNVNTKALLTNNFYFRIFNLMRFIFGSYSYVFGAMTNLENKRKSQNIIFVVKRSIFGD